MEIHPLYSTHLTDLRLLKQESSSSVSRGTMILVSNDGEGDIKDSESDQSQ